MAREKGQILGRFDLDYNERKLNIKAADIPGAYVRHSAIHINGTGNCQLMVMEYANNIISGFDKYQLREALIRIRKNHYSKKILLMDLNKQFADKIRESLSPGSIISQTDYKSTNGSKMNLTLIKLSNIRQFGKIPDPI
jgi:hypothetical protein